MSKPQNNTDEKREISALILSFVIHAALVVTIVIAGVRLALPPGTVSTEVDFTPTDKPVAAPLVKAPRLEREEPLVPQKVADKSTPQIVPPKRVQELPEKTRPVPAPLKTPKLAKALTPQIQDPDSDLMARISPVPKDELKPVKDSFADDIKQSDEAEKPDIAEKVPPIALKEEPPKTEEKVPPPVIENRQEEAPAQVAENAPTANSTDASADSNESAAAAGDPNSSVKEAWQLKAIAGNVPPEYPMMSRLRRQEGVANFRYTVNKDGTVSNIRVEKSSGFAALDEAAAKALAKYRYSPGQASEVRIPFAFRLSGEVKQMPGALRRTK